MVRVMAGRRPQAKKAYHHGNLRRELVTAALEIINRRGPEGLTLRAVADRLGVTATAPYRHFPSKQALLAAVATEGFTTMLDGIRLAQREAGADPLARYEAMAVGYVRFATAHPEHFRVMYGPRVDFDSVAVTDRRTAFGMLTGAIEDCQAAGQARAGDPRPIANQAWAYAHGVITLFLHGLLHRSIGVPELTALAREIRVFLNPTSPTTPHQVGPQRPGSAERQRSVHRRRPARQSPRRRRTAPSA